MGSKRCRKGKKSRSCPFDFQTLISSISSPQGLKPETMEGLYLLLLSLCCSNCETNLNFSETEFYLKDFKIKFKDIREMSNLLFDKLSSKFKELFAALNDVPACLGRGQSVFHVNVKATIKELTLLLRCCIAVFMLLGLDQKVVIDKGRMLLGLLRRCVSVELKGGNWKTCGPFEKENSHEGIYVDDDGTSYLAGQSVTSISFSEPSDPFHAILCAVLEKKLIRKLVPCLDRVIVKLLCFDLVGDELLMHESVRQYLLLVDSCSNANEFLFISHFGPGNTGIVLEVISAHFILCISDDQAFKNFLNRLSWLPDNNFRVPEMTLATALSLLVNPILLSAPKMFQAYLILLVSEVIETSMTFEHIIPSSDLTLYLSAFERSVALYTRHMSSLHKKGYPIVDDDSFVKSHFHTSNSRLDFESCLLPATKEKIYNLITKCENLWNSYLSSTLLKERSDLVTASVAYTKESLHVFEESTRDKILSILSCIILRGSSDVDDTVPHNKKDTSPQDICLLASILKLMSGSLLQAIKILTLGRTSGSLKTLENVSLSKEYDFMVATFNCFRQFGLRLPVQKFLHDLMKLQPTSHKKSKWMFFHFSGLLSLSYATGLDFLVKNCISTLMVLLKLFILEEGDLYTFESLLDSGVKSSSFKSRIEVEKSKSHRKAGEVLEERKSSRAVALKFQKIQTLYLGMGSRKSSSKRAQKLDPGSLRNAPIVNHVESALSIEENTGETCNGEIFLRCMLEGSQKSSDIDDLADFIECDQGKDYSDWLRARAKFRQWKSEKVANFRWKKKRRIFQKRA